MSFKKVVYVDKKDRAVGSGTISGAYEAGYALRIVRIFIVNDKGEILLQKRSKNVPSSSKWDQSAGGHVDVGETYLKAAKRELSEEMGIKGVKLTRISKFYTEDQPFGYLRRRFNVMYYGKYSGPVAIDSEEVAGYLWISQPKLDEWIRKSPEEFTNGFLISYEKLQGCGVL